MKSALSCDSRMPTDTVPTTVSVVRRRRSEPSLARTHRECPPACPPTRHRSAGRTGRSRRRSPMRAGIGVRHPDSRIIRHDDVGDIRGLADDLRDRLDRGRRVGVGERVLDRGQMRDRLRHGDHPVLIRAADRSLLECGGDHAGDEYRKADDQGLQEARAARGATSVSRVEFTRGAFRLPGRISYRTRTFTCRTGDLLSEYSCARCGESMFGIHSSCGGNAVSIDHSRRSGMRKNSNHGHLPGRGSRPGRLLRHFRRSGTHADSGRQSRRRSREHRRGEDHRARRPRRRLGPDRPRDGARCSSRTGWSVRPRDQCRRRRRDRGIREPRERAATPTL